MGSDAGAVYFPLVSIVPSVVEPPAVPLTDQVTLVFCVPVTVAWKVNESPARTFAVDGVTLTDTPDGCGFGPGEDTVCDTPPAHPASAAAAIHRAVFLQMLGFVGIGGCSVAECSGRNTPCA